MAANKETLEGVKEFMQRAKDSTSTPFAAKTPPVKKEVKELKKK